jgi:hypothetical protein
MALNFDLLQPANIRENFMAGRKEAQDMETGRLQQQEARMKLEDFQQKQAGLDRFLAKAKERGKDGDPLDIANDYYEWTVSQRNPELITQAITLAQTAAQRKKFNAMQNPNQLAGTARPAAPIAGALGSGTFDPNASAPTNALAPTAAPSVMTPSNALAFRAAAPVAPAKADRVAEIKSRLSQLNEFPDVPQAKAEAALLLEEVKRLTTPQIVASGSSVYNPQTGTFTQAPERVDTDLIRNYNAAKNDGFVGSILDYQQRIAAAGRAPATPSAPVAVIGPNGEEIFVSREEALSKRMTPASGARLKPIPTQINQAIIKNVQTLKQLDDTIALLGKNPDATGYKGYLPNVVLSRVDPEGVDVRAGIADIGSLVLHERSGAAVTAAESPRLLPFIPLATDDNATAVKKLKRMREIAAADQLGLTETYSEDQGYKANPLVGKDKAAPAAAPAIPTIYATNGKQRLQSTDGGKNWTPVK